MKNTVTQEQIDKIWSECTITTNRVFGKCLVVTVQLKNGFIITESSACVDPANYDETIGWEICKERIINKIWELEGYKLQDQLHHQS